MSRHVAARAIPLVLLAVALSGCTGDATPAPPQPGVSTTAATPSPSASTEPEPSIAPADAPAVAWPPAVSEADFFDGTEAAAVWLVAGPYDDVQTWDALEADAAEVGYDVAAIPVGCHAPSYDAFPTEEGEVWGLPVLFASDAEAAAFVALWTASTPVVVGVGTISCDFG